MTKKIKNNYGKTKGCSEDRKHTVHKKNPVKRNTLFNH